MVEVVGDHLDMVIERDQVDMAGSDPIEDFGDFVERVGFETQVEAGIGQELGAQAREGVDHEAAVLDAAQAGLPGDGEAVVGGGDAVREDLTVAIDKSDVEGEEDAAAGHPLAFEGVAVEID